MGDVKANSMKVTGHFPQRFRRTGEKQRYLMILEPKWNRELHIGIKTPGPAEKQEALMLACGRVEQ